MPDLPKILPLGDNAITVDFGNVISLELNQRVISLAEHLTMNPFPGFVEAVPAYSSLAIFYDTLTTRAAFPERESAFDAVRRIVSRIDVEDERSTESRLIEIPVDFGPNAALDLSDVADLGGLSTKDVVEIFTNATYRVFMLGFLPGFAYMGEVDERIAAPRRQAPRLKVPKGSVGIAGRQTGIYPLESPGGWQIIGRTDLELFTPEAEEPCMLRPGDNVRFVRRDQLQN
ncbi:MAG TPA: 5-oxoprolinase subunit PxpB [Pyrinomonadaceae bacterium]|nr:5-oxoprolinase subunit PxpB [Pyrinomonadaceae bacterium]